MEKIEILHNLIKGMKYGVTKSIWNTVKVLTREIYHDRIGIKLFKYYSKKDKKYFIENPIQLIRRLEKMRNNLENERERYRISILQGL